MIMALLFFTVVNASKVFREETENVSLSCVVGSEFYVPKLLNSLLVDAFNARIIHQNNIALMNFWLKSELGPLSRQKIF